MYWPCGVPQIFVHHVKPATDVKEGSEDDEVIHEEAPPPDQEIIDVSSTRSDHLFATITASSLNVWSARPTVVLATFERSRTSIESFGENAKVLFRPDGSIIAIRTTKDYILTLAIEADPSHRVLQQHYGYSQSRRQNVIKHFGVDESYGLTELYLHFRRVIKIDAGIRDVLANEQELVVATVKPAAIQCIRWEPPREGPQAVAQVLSKLDWMDKSTVALMTYDRAMNLNIWIASDGSAYAVQRSRPRIARNMSSDDGSQPPKSPGTSSNRLYDGFCFHRTANGKATCAAINARFSLLAVAVENGSILCYVAKDYVGNVPLSHTLQSGFSAAITGDIVSLAWSPDGYCLFVAYEKGWMTWSVFGRDGPSTFHSNPDHAETSGDTWLTQVRTATWLSQGAEILLTAGTLDIFKLDFARSAAVGYFSCANLVRALIQTPNEVQIYKGHELPDLTSISSESSLWHHAQYPPAYLNNQWPIRSTVISQDGRYVAVAGRRGIAHYSVNSGRWKTFSDPAVEASFAMRGGMCWFGHVLAVATENAAGNDLRLYSRDLDLGRSPLYTEIFNMPIVFVGPSGEDSLLVYTHENILYHYVISIDNHKAQLIQVGQIAFHGVVRAPSRVRSVSWVVPESQLRNGDPSRDVEFASVLFLVDDKLVLLQPSRTPEDELKYDLRVIAQHVEYYILMRDQLYFNFTGMEGSAPQTPSPGNFLGGSYSQRQEPFSLRDSLWTFTGQQLRLWPSVRDVLNTSSSTELSETLVNVPVDFYPLSILLTKGIVLGIETTLLQRRDIPFPLFRPDIRTQLFLPYVIRHQLLIANDHAAAFAAANQYQHLSYFPHALEILLHHVLDDEHERKRKLAKAQTRDDDESNAEVALTRLSLDQRTPTQPSYNPEDLRTEPLPATLSFLQLSLSPTTYLSTLVQCIRKTEVTVWPTLFEHLPTPVQMFEDALALEDLKTASGVLIILQGLEDEAELDGSHPPQGRSEQDDDVNNGEDIDHVESNVDEQDDSSATTEADSRRTDLHSHITRLMSLAYRTGDYDLCAELARFVMGIDPGGQVLKRVVAEVPGLASGGDVVPPSSNQHDNQGQSSHATVMPITRQAGLGLGLNVLKTSTPRASRPATALSGDVGTSSGNIGNRAMKGEVKKSPMMNMGGDYFSDSPGGY